MTTQTQSSAGSVILSGLIAAAIFVIVAAFMAYPAAPDPRQECADTLAEAGVVTDGRALHRACR